MKISGSEALWRALLNEGVDTVFGYPGGAIMPVYDALYDFQDSVRHILVRHEQGAAHAAQGYARVTGRAGVAMATSGPGATNLVTGIADALMDSVPLVCITGQVFANLLGTDAFQETDVIGVTIPITKWNYQVTKAEEIPEAIAKAFYIAQKGRPGPVLVDITKNAQVELFEYQPRKVDNLPNFFPRPALKESAIAQAVEIINASKQPLILCGHGVLISGCEQELQQLAERADIPIACTLHGLSSIPSTFPQYVGMLGMHGNYGPNRLTNKADVIIAVGMRFDDRVTGKLSTYATEAKVIHIDIDAAELNKNVRALVGINADAKEALQAILPGVARAQRPAWFAQFAECHEKEYATVIEREILPSEGELKMAEVIHQLSELTAGEAIVVGDVGQHQMISARYYRFAKPHSWITSGGLGTMGFALPAAMGAKVAAPEREVIAVIGDGCFQMTIQELGTIAQENLGVKAVILNNNFLGMVRQWQELFFDRRYSFVEMKNPDFVAISKGFGITAERVSERSELTAALRRMLETDGPYVLEVMVEKEDNVFPMVPAGACVSDVRLE
ncbi:MAG: biosynthetic-type acetolactate synthase large subunit [Bdellovibrionales bacterium]|nr:biosynthetic-type acetolactate synthase large subunit [Bdellovibrionales bacterium]